MTIKCTECKQCNSRGKPSVMRNSAYCDSHIKVGIRVNRSGLFRGFMDFLFNRHFDDKEGKLKTTKGFRSDYFLR